MTFRLPRAALVAAAGVFLALAAAADDPKPDPAKKDGDKFADGDFVIGPAYKDAPELTVKDGVPRGTVKQFVMDSTDSKIYPGIARKQQGVVPYKRKVWVYVPKQHEGDAPIPFI